MTVRGSHGGPPNQHESTKERNLEGPVLAVTSFEVALQDNDPRGGLMADLLTTGLAARFPVVDRKDLAKVLAEQTLSLQGLVSPDQAARIGKLAGAQFVIGGRVFRLADRAFVVVRVISVETARFVGLIFSLSDDAGLDQLVART